MPSLQREQSCMADADAVGTIYFIGVSSVFCPFSLSTQRVRKWMVTQGLMWQGNLWRYVLSITRAAVSCSHLLSNVRVATTPPCNTIGLVHVHDTKVATWHQSGYAAQCFLWYVLIKDAMCKIGKSFCMAIIQLIGKFSCVGPITYVAPQLYHFSYHSVIFV